MNLKTALFAAFCFFLGASCGGDDKPPVGTEQSAVTSPANYKIGDGLLPTDSLTLVGADEFNTGEMVNTDDCTHESGYITGKYNTTPQPVPKTAHCATVCRYSPVVAKPRHSGT